jgi:membrane protease YdiL (CAAX protease family)
MSASPPIVTTASPRWRGDADMLATLALVLACAWAVSLLAGSPAPWQTATIVLVAPFAEESLMRAGLQDWMLQRGVTGWQANCLVAFCFALLHWLGRADAILAVAVLAPALLIGAIYDRYRNLRLCIAAHVLMNAFWLSFGSSLSSAVSIR